MINSIIGEVTHKDSERVLIMKDGVEWDVATTSKSSESFPERGETARVYTFVYHRDDQLKLYGFASIAERELFLDLLKVEGLGPRIALRILSGIEVAAFVEALDAEDVDLLASVPGLGRKTAQKIVLKLKGKLTFASEAKSSVEADIGEALVGMGFERKRAKDAVRQAVRDCDLSSMTQDEIERELIKKAIEIAGRRD